MIRSSDEMVVGYYVRESQTQQLVLNDLGMVPLFDTMHAASTYALFRMVRSPMICDVYMPESWRKTSPVVEPGSIIADEYPHILSDLTWRGGVPATSKHPTAIRGAKRLIVVRRRVVNIRRPK